MRQKSERYQGAAERTIKNKARQGKPWRAVSQYRLEGCAQVSSRHSLTRIRA
jgi:hypothetical protein